MFIILNLFYLNYGWCLYCLYPSELFIVFFIYAFYIKCLWVIVDPISAGVLNEKGIFVRLLSLFKLYDKIKFEWRNVKFIDRLILMAADNLLSAFCL